MKSFSRHLSEERRQLNEAFPVLFAAALGARIFGPIILRAIGPALVGTTTKGLIVRIAAGLGFTRYRGEDGLQKLTKDLEGAFQFVIGIIPPAWRDAIGNNMELIKRLIIVMIVIMGALAVLQITLPVAKRMISRMLRRREVVSAVKEELDQGDIDAAQEIMIEALSKVNPDVRLTDLQRVLNSDDFNKVTRELHQKL